MTQYINKIMNIDGIAAIRDLPESYVHLILSDIPYGIGVDDWDVLHDNKNSAFLGTSPGQIKAGAVFKKRGKPINGWSEADREIPKQYYEWCSTWAKEWLRVIKPGSSVFIFAGRRFSHRCITALEDAGFSFKDMFAWLRQRAPHRAQRISIVFERRGDMNKSAVWEGWRVGNLRPTFEPVLWFTKPYKIGTTIADNVLNHGVGAFNEEAFLKYEKSPDNVLNSGYIPGELGFHPTQKPIRLMQALIELTTQQGQIVLDPFCGSGSTLLAAKLTGRNYIGFEINKEYAIIAEKRLKYESIKQIKNENIKQVKLFV
ncbi:MAG: site-specific DNA-methyltransferase [Pirellulales bacterium]|nr:site-specific DNA-methyltransferase [Pirellulales bacterium]